MRVCVYVCGCSNACACLRACVCVCVDVKVRFLCVFAQRARLFSTNLCYFSWPTSETLKTAQSSDLGHRYLLERV